MAITRSRMGDERGIDGDHDERAGAAPGLIRALITLIGLVGAGFLIWLATTFDLGTTGGFWVAMGLIAAAGLALGLSQLLGGWTKWGWPRFSPSVFLFAFLPVLVIAGGFLLAMRPAGEETEQVRGWAQDLGIGGLVADLSEFPGLLAFTIGLVFAFCFDTSGPRTRILERDRGDRVLDDDAHDYRHEPATGATTRREATEDTHERTVAEEIHDRDERTAADRTTTVEERSDTVGTPARDDREGSIGPTTAADRSETERVERQDRR